MKIEVLEDAGAVAEEAAAIIAADARIAVAARGRFVFAVSGGSTPWRMLRALADKRGALGRTCTWCRWTSASPRTAIPSATSRTCARACSSTRRCVPSRSTRCPSRRRIWRRGCRSYAETLREIAGSPAVLDLVHLGLGPDGHTASLVPGDPVLEVDDADVALAGPYQGRRRMTLTYPMLDRARRVLWLVTGAEKAEMLVRLLDGDRSIPAGRVRRDRALVLADRPAAAQLQ